MRMQLKQAGFSGVEAVIILVIAGVIGGVGYSVYHRSNNVITSSSVPVAKQSAKAQNVSQAPAVQSTSDLNTASTTLDKNDPSSTNGSDLDQLDSESLGY